MSNSKSARTGPAIGDALNGEPPLLLKPKDTAKGKNQKLAAMAIQRSGLAKGWTTADVAELEEIVAELRKVREREGEVQQRFRRLKQRVESAATCELRVAL